MTMGSKGSAKLEIEGLEQAQRAFDPFVVEKALAVTIIYTLRTTRTQISKQVRNVYEFIKARDVKEAVGLKVHRLSFSPPSFELRYSAKRISLRKFGAEEVPVMSAKGPRKGVKVKIRKDRGWKLIRAGGGYSGGFFGPNNQVYVRIRDTRKPIEKRTGIAIPQMVGTQETQTMAYSFMKKELPRQFKVNLSHFIEKAKGRR